MEKREGEAEWPKRNAMPEKFIRGFGQDGDVRKTLRFLAQPKGLTTNVKTINNQKWQKIKLHGTPITKELKKHPSRLVRGTETGDRQPNEDDAGNTEEHAGKARLAE